MKETTITSNGKNSSFTIDIFKLLLVFHFRGSSLLPPMEPRILAGQAPQLVVSYNL